MNALEKLSKSSTLPDFRHLFNKDSVTREAFLTNTSLLGFGVYEAKILWTKPLTTLDISVINNMNWGINNPNNILDDRTRNKALVIFESKDACKEQNLFYDDISPQGIAHINSYFDFLITNGCITVVDEASGLGAGDIVKILYNPKERTTPAIIQEVISKQNFSFSSTVEEARNLVKGFIKLDQNEISTGRMELYDLDNLNNNLKESKNIPKGAPYFYKARSAEQIKLFEDAAEKYGLPKKWANNKSFLNVYTHESGGWVGRPNSIYGKISSIKYWDSWPKLWQYLREGKFPPIHSRAIGLPQMIPAGIKEYNPNGYKGIGVPIDEAASMLIYIKHRYKTPEIAWEKWQERAAKSDNGKKGWY